MYYVLTKLLSDKKGQFLAASIEFNALVNFTNYQIAHAIIKPTYCIYLIICKYYSVSQVMPSRAWESSSLQSPARDMEVSFDNNTLVLLTLS